MEEENKMTNSHADERKNNMLSVCSDTVVSTVKFILFNTDKRSSIMKIICKYGSGILARFVSIYTKWSILRQRKFCLECKDHSPVGTNGLVLTVF